MFSMVVKFLLRQAIYWFLSSSANNNCHYYLTSLLSWAIIATSLSTCFIVQFQLTMSTTTSILTAYNTLLGLLGFVLDWFKFDLHDRMQSINIWLQVCQPSPVRGVHQESVLYAILFTIYALPIGDIICSSDTGCHLHADDTKLILSCNVPTCPKFL